MSIQIVAAEQEQPVARGASSRTFPGPLAPQIESPWRRLWTFSVAFVDAMENTGHDIQDRRLAALEAKVGMLARRASTNL